MKLSAENLKDRAFWESKGFKLPAFDLGTVIENTHREPAWLHFGPGNIFRMFPAVAQQELLNRGETKTGIIVCEAFDEEVIDMAFTPFDNLTVAATLTTGAVEKEIVASVTESVKASSGMDRLYEIFKCPSLQMASFTITEKGYAVYDSSGNTLPYIKADMEAGPEGAKSLMGLTTRLIFVRFGAGKLPLALVSMDNCAENGDKLREAVTAIASAWCENGKAPKEFLDYLKDDKYITFPCSMIDKITPRPSELIAEHLETLGIEGMEITKTSRNTFVAPFVNAEPTQYLVIENAFPNGRPSLEKTGIIFTDRETVDKAEKMKVGACLNPLHSILGIFGCLLGYKFIHEAMGDRALANLAKRSSYKEALPHVEDPGIIRPEDFLKNSIEVRLPNPYIPDTPQRIAMDTSQKISVRFGEALKKMAEAGDAAGKLEAFPFFFAGWLRYLLGTDDNGEALELSPDPMMAELRGILGNIKLGDKGPFSDTLKPILSNKAIFGVNLYDVGLAEKTEGFFERMNEGPGAVASALKEYFGNDI